MASSIVNKLIHNTMVTLKSEVTSADGAAFVEAARRFFNLSERDTFEHRGHRNRRLDATNERRINLGSGLERSMRSGTKSPKLFTARNAERHIRA